MLAFRWTAAGGPLNLGDLPGGSVNASASDVSADGNIVIGNGTTPDGNRPFIWDAPHGMRNLRDVLVTDYGLDLTGWTLTEAYGLSADGVTIVGTGTDSLGRQQAWVATLPEPALAGAILLSGTALRLRRRRRVRERGPA